MLSSQRKRPKASSTKFSKGGTRQPILSAVDRKFKSKNKGGGYMNYIIFGGLAMILVTIIIIIMSLKSKANQTQQPYNLEEIQDLVEKTKHSDKFINKIRAQGKHPQHQFNVPNPNAVKVTFRIYLNPTCDESDPSKYMDITKESADVAADSVGSNCPLCYPLCGQKINENDGRFLNERGQLQGIKIISNDIPAQIDLYSDCGLTQYHSSIYDFEGCVHIFDWPSTAGIKIKRNYLDFPQKLPPPISAHALPPLQEHLIRDGISEESKKLAVRNDIPSYLITYSCESSEYCAFQAQANYYGFLTSGQHPSKSGFLRLLTAQEPDDMATYIPTFTAPRNLYSRRYSPYNKADVMVKWFESKPNRPDDYDIIVVIDPDNWIIRDITHWIVKASEGHALGEAAWFHGSHLVTELWKEVCQQNCDWELDMVGVPYIVHRNDLAKIAPYFKLYINIMKEREERDPEFLNKYKGIQMGWGTEMFGYIFGAAHAGIKHEVVHGIQRRDVSARPGSKKEELGIDMIHMGRAWWPKDYPLSAYYMHTEGKAWSRFGTQVWCKCNYTASDIIPWPMPDTGVDFQSYHTLYLLHYGREYFGALPSSKYRKPAKRYHEPYP